MNIYLHGLSGSIALVIGSTAGAQAAMPAQQTTSTTTQQGPAATQTTTTRTTTNTVPGTLDTPAQSATTTSRSTATTPTDSSGAPVGPTQSSATTTSTTTSNAGAVAAATAADVKSGVSVYDQKGGLVGKVESVSAGNAVVNAGGIRAAIPVASFAKNDRGLVISMTRAELEASAKSAAKTTKAKGSKKSK